MPTYEYTCKKCGERLEVFQKFSDKPLKKHADCGGELVKVLYARGIVFKGSGFYATDGRGSSTRSSSSNGSSSKSESSAAAAD
ncbi:MAG: zinc ribbon domain-containing protein [Actinomycetes bacterium]|jgi:putative FmdB family regulatory protein|nr:MAG: FmdB family transcriptional regulator [Actinomycetota bacterium]